MWLDATLLSACSAVPTFPLAMALKPQLKTRLSRALGPLPVTYIRVSPRHCQLAARGSMPGRQHWHPEPSFARNRATGGISGEARLGTFMKPGLHLFNPACEKPRCLLAFPPVP